MIDKYYQKMIDDITDSASDREQLLIIEALVVALRDWQSLYEPEGSVEALYYINLNKILDIIKDTLKKEDLINAKSNI